MNTNEQFIYDFFHTLWFSKDLTVLETCMAQDVLIDGVLGFAIGIAGKRKIVHAWYTGFPNSIGNIDRIISCGTQVALRWSAQSRHEGVFCDLPASGKYINYMGDCNFQIKDQKIVSYRGVSTINNAFIQEGLKLKLPNKSSHCAALINAARYLNGARLETIEVIVLALTIIGETTSSIAQLLNIANQDLLLTLKNITNKIGLPSSEWYAALVTEGSSNMFLKIAEVAKNAAF